MLNMSIYEVTDYVLQAFLLGFVGGFLATRLLDVAEKLFKGEKS